LSFISTGLAGEAAKEKKSENDKRTEYFKKCAKPENELKDYK